MRGINDHCVGQRWSQLVLVERDRWRLDTGLAQVEKYCTRRLAVATSSVEFTGWALRIRGFEAWQRRRGCGTTRIRTMGAMLLNGSGAAAKRGPLHDHCIGMTAVLRYGTIAHGSRIKDWRRDTEGYMSDSADMLPSADVIHSMAANVQLCSTSSPSQDLVTTACLPAWEPAQEFAIFNMDCPGLPAQKRVLCIKRGLLSSVSRLVSPDDPSYTRSSRRDYGRRTG
jgi:hypothetical protein